MDRKKDRKEEEKREKKEQKEQKEREKREKEKAKETKLNKSPRPNAAPVISGPILPLSMMAPLTSSARTGSTRSSPPSDPAPVVMGSQSKVQQLLGAEVASAPNGNTGSVSKMQQLLGEVPPGVSATPRSINGLPKPLDAGAGGSSRRVNNDATALPPPPLLKPLVKPKPALMTPTAFIDLPPPPDLPLPHRPGSMAGAGAEMPSPTESPKRPAFPTADSTDDLLDANIKSMGGEDGPAQPEPPTLVPHKSKKDDSDDSSETDSDEERPATATSGASLAEVKQDAPAASTIDSTVRDPAQGTDGQDWTDSPVQDELLNDQVQDHHVRSRDLSAADLLPPPDTKAIEAASLWSDDPPLPVAPVHVPIVTPVTTPVMKPKAVNAPKPTSHPFRLVLNQADGEARPRAGTGTEKPTFTSLTKPGGSMRGQVARPGSAPREPRPSSGNAAAPSAGPGESMFDHSPTDPTQTAKRHAPTGLSNSQIVEEAVAQTTDTSRSRRVRDSDGRESTGEPDDSVTPLPALEEATAQLVSLSPQASPRSGISQETARWGPLDESGQPTLLGATVERLVQELTPDRVPNARLLNVTLLTFRCAFKPREFYDALTERWALPAPVGLAPDQWKAMRQAIRLRLLNVFKSWLERHPSEWRGSEMMELLAEFVDRNSAEVPAPGSVLSRVMNRVRAGEAIQENTDLPLPKPPKPLAPSKRNPVSFLEIPPLEVARQLTLIDWSLFKRLEATELIGQAWKRDTRAKDAPNIIGLISRSDYVSGLVATEILRQEKPKERAMVISRLLQIADECRGLNNWNSTMAVLSGLRTQPIYRLQDTWAQLTPKAWELWDNLKEIIKPEENYSKLRQLMSVPVTPAIPFLGVYLGDLIKLDENETYLPNTRLVNLTKLRAIADVIFRVQAMQRSTYSLEVVAGVQEFLTTAPVFGENELFKQSVQREEKKSQAARKQ